MSFDHLHAAMVFATLRVAAIYERLETDCVITSGNDSRHMRGSKHYDGKALDFRTKTLLFLLSQSRENELEKLRAEIQRALGPQYRVLLEDIGRENEHLHIQFQGE